MSVILVSVCEELLLVSSEFDFEIMTSLSIIKSTKSEASNILYNGDKVKEH